MGVVQNNGTLESLSWITILFLLSSTLQEGDIDNDTTEILTTRAPSGSYTEEQASYNTVGCALGLTCVNKSDRINNYFTGYSYI